MQNQLKLRFPEERGLALREVEFFNRTQKPTENAETYANALKEIAKKIYCNTTAEVRNRQIISQFLRGLSFADMRQQVINMDKEDPTLDDYVRRAMQLHLWAPNGTLAQSTKKDNAPQLIAEVLTKLSNMSVHNPSVQNDTKGKHCNFCRNRHFPYKNHNDSECFR